MADEVGPELFEPHIGGEFSAMIDGGEPVVLRLTGVARLPGHPLRAEPFSLELTGDLDRTLEQGTYRIERVGFEALDVFLVPTGPHDGEMRYHSVFN